MFIVFHFQAMDTFICGTCQDAFNDIEVFMQHKQTGCTRPPPEIIQVHVDQTGEVTEVTGADGVMGNDLFLLTLKFNHLTEVPLLQAKVTEVQ